MSEKRRRVPFVPMIVPHDISEVTHEAVTYSAEEIIGARRLKAFDHDFADMPEAELLALLRPLADVGSNKR